jgi:hypothetical protein
MTLVPMRPMPEGIECSWCGSDHSERPNGEPFRNREGEYFCSKNHRTASTRALHRLQGRLGGPPEPVRKAFLDLDGWAGRSREPVLVVSETPKRYRIRNPSDEPLRLAGRSRYLRPGAETLVPKSAITFKK